MTFFALIATLFSFVLVVLGVCVHMYLYSNGAFDEGTRRNRRKTRLIAATLSQTATISTPISSQNGSYKYIPTRTNSGSLSPRKRLLVLYTLAFLVTLAVLIVLVMGATQF